MTQKFISKLPGFVIILFFSLMAGCKPSQPYADLKTDCATPGEIQSGEVETTGSGIPYRFMVYLPPCYAAGADPGYPALYMIPGRSGGPGDWFSAGINQTADQLILDGETPPFVIVTTQEITSDPLAEAIYNDLIPFIESHYNTLTDRAHRAAGGGSLGGIAAYRLGLQHPEAFASVGMFGSGVINGENERVESWLAAILPENPMRFFLNTGENDPLMLAQARVMATMLDEAGIPYRMVIGDGDHSYAYWTTNMEVYFRWVAEDW